MAAGVLAVGVLCELVVLGDYRGQLTWMQPLLLVVVGAACLVCLVTSNRPARAVAISAAVAALLVAPSIWAIDTLGYPTQGTFPAGGPAGRGAEQLTGEFRQRAATGVVVGALRGEVVAQRGLLRVTHPRVAVRLGGAVQFPQHRDARGTRGRREGSGGGRHDTDISAGRTD